MEREDDSDHALRSPTSRKDTVPPEIFVSTMIMTGQPLYSSPSFLPPAFESSDKKSPTLSFQQQRNEPEHSFNTSVRQQQEQGDEELLSLLHSPKPSTNTSSIHKANQWRHRPYATPTGTTTSANINPRGQKTKVSSAASFVPNRQAHEFLNYWKFVLQTHGLKLFLIASTLINIGLLWDAETILFTTHSATYQTKLAKTCRSNVNQQCKIDPIHSAFPTSDHVICKKVASPSAMYVWNELLEYTIQASQLPGDLNFQLKELTKQILKLISPRLPLSTSTLPRHIHDSEIIGRILDKAWNRYDYLTKKRIQKLHNNPTATRTAQNEKDKVAPPPIKIVVMGGSVTYGHGCSSGVSKYHEHRTCAWPHRLQHFINQLFEFATGTDVLVLVTNAAAGGTNSDIGAAALQYNVLARQLEDADIIINAYSSNDNACTNQTELSQMLESFYRQVYSKPHPCQLLQRQQQVQQSTKDGNSEDICKNSTKYGLSSFSSVPLVIHIDDWVGNPLSLVQKTLRIPQIISTLSNYYGFAAISYPNVVRDLVYMDSTETWFSPGADLIHPGQGFHIAMSWIVAYNLLDWTMAFCNVEEQYHQQQKLAKKSKNAVSNRFQVPKDVDSLILQGMPHPPSHFEETYLLPNLNSTLTIGDVAKTIGNSEEALKSPTTSSSTPTTLPSIRDCPSLLNLNHSHAAANGGDERQEQRESQPSKPFHQCPFAWVSDHGFTGTAWLKSNIISRTVEESTWNLEPPHTSKRGFVPPPNADEALGSHFTVAFSNVTQPIRTVAIFYMKSYGPSWKNSKARVRVLSYDDTTKLNDKEMIVNRTRKRQLKAKPQKWQKVKPTKGKWKNQGTTWGKTKMKQNGPKNKRINQQNQVQQALALETERDTKHGRITVATKVLDGYIDDKKSSEMYVQEMKLSPQIPIGGNLRIRTTLIDGTTFKLMGLSICS